MIDLLIKFFIVIILLFMFYVFILILELKNQIEPDIIFILQRLKDSF